VDKTEYRTYLNSSQWQKRRRVFLAKNDSCARCQIPRWLAEIAYNQDLNVHHISYANLGAESWDDLEPLCRRCHEVEKFGRSDLRKPKNTVCNFCGSMHFNYYRDACAVCDTVFESSYLNILNANGMPIGHHVFALLAAFSILRGESKIEFMAHAKDMYEAGGELAESLVS
jgi:hypothetical protein